VISSHHCEQGILTKEGLPLPLLIARMSMWTWLQSTHGRASDSYNFSFCALNKIFLPPFLALVLEKMLFWRLVIPIGLYLSHLELYVAIPFLHDLLLPQVLCNICFSSVIYFYPEDRSNKFFLNFSTHSPGYTSCKPEDHNLNLNCLTTSNLDISCIQNCSPFIVTN